MTAQRPTGFRDEEFWRQFLTHPDSFQSMRRIFARIPTSPRCQLCAAPFAGIGRPLMRVIGKHPSTNSPSLCNACERLVLKHHGGAEIDSSLLFADIRGSTALAEHMSPTEFRVLLDRFYAAASEAVFAHNGVIDKFVGDEVVASFPPMLGAEHARRAVAAGRAVLEATGHADARGPWVSVGAGVHTGRVWFGAVGDGQHVEITVVGDAVNTTARLAAAAAAGEILVSADAAIDAGMDPSLERRSLDLKGKEMPIDVVSVRVQAA